MRLYKYDFFKNYLFLITFSLFIEIIFRLIANLPILNYSLLRIFLANSILSIIISYISSLFSKKISHIINLSYLFLISIYSLCQLAFNNYIGVYMSFNASGQLGAIKDYIIDFIKAIKPNYYLTLLPLIVAILYVILIPKIFKKRYGIFTLKRKYKYHNAIIFIEVILLLFFFGTGYYYLLGNNYSTDNYQAVSNKDLFLNIPSEGLFVKEFGIFTFGVQDLRNKFAKKDTIITTYNELAQAKITSSNREFDDSNWEILINEEMNAKYNNLNKYYINKIIDDKNKYTAYFENKNLIVILMESVNDIIYNKKYFPNFYKMASDGWYFENNYSPRNSCATGNNEFSSLTGLYAVYNTCSPNTYRDNDYYEALFNLFNNKGYYTSSFHNFNENYYYRSIYHLKMGSQKYYGIEDLNIPWSLDYGEWTSDVDLMSRYLELLLENKGNKKFMSYITTVSAHNPYNYSTKFGDMYLDMTENTDLPMDMRRYYSKLKEFDNALGVLLKGLEDNNLLDDTVIVMFGDHYPYALDEKTLKSVLTRSIDDYEIDKTPLVIYNPKIKGEVFDTYTTYVNLTPTIANLFNLNFDPRLYAGEDIFNPNYSNMAVFADSSWKNDLAYYDASTGRITYYTDFKYAEEEIKKINYIIYDKLNTSSQSIKNNYFKYLYDKLEEISSRNINEGIMDKGEKEN